MSYSKEVKIMADQHKGIALVILGIVAIIAVVGLVLLFMRGSTPTGEGVYGGAIKQVQYPNWIGRGTPRNMPQTNGVPGELWPSTQGKDLTTNWNYYGSPKRDPASDVPSPLIKCGNGGFLIPYSNNQPQYYRQRGYTVIETGDQQAGLCVYPNTPMVGGIAI